MAPYAGDTWPDTWPCPSSEPLPRPWFAWHHSLLATPELATRPASAAACHDAMACRRLPRPCPSPDRLSSHSFASQRSFSLSLLYSAHHNHPLATIAVAQAELAVETPPKAFLCTSRPLEWKLIGLLKLSDPSSPSFPHRSMDAGEQSHRRPPLAVAPSSPTTPARFQPPTGST